MGNRIRWCARFAGTFLLWVEEVVPDPESGPPWRGHVFSRPPAKPCDESFTARDEESAKEDAENTIRNGFAGYAHRLGKKPEKALEWKACDLSNGEWEQERTRFIETGE
jgi:hypothetical protein